MSASKINLVVIGHKDHGKSTLIGRLLYDSHAITEQKLQEVEAELRKSGDEGFRFAFLLDTLEEERRGGLTIDIMQTPFRTKGRLYTIIDCPGHREFIKKMLTGASQADAAVLVVSSKEGVEDQTRQHAFLVKTLGINQLVVAINKMDEVGYDEGAFARMSRSLDGVLAPLGFGGAPKVPISAFNGDNVFTRSANMKWYGGPTLVDVLDEAVRPRPSLADLPLRACVQDVYGGGVDRMVVCKVETGVLEAGRRVLLSPSGDEAAVRALGTFGGEIERAGPGESVGLSLNGAPDPKRGEVVSYPEAGARAARSFVANVILFSGAEIKDGDVCTVRCGTAERRCRADEVLKDIDPLMLTVSAVSPGALRGGGVGEVRFRPLEPMCVEVHSDFPPLGRFVIEGGRGPTGAGIILSVEHGDAEEVGSA
jgi:elongation factor 1-alpha